MDWDSTHEEPTRVLGWLQEVRAQSCPTLWDPWTVACQAPVHGILQAMLLQQVAISFCRGSSRPRDRICVSCIGRYHWCHLPAEGKWCYWWCFPQGGRLQAEGAGMKWLDFLSFLSLKPLMRSIIYCSAQESLGQQISLRPQNADWINVFSLGSFFWVSFFTEQLPETGSVYYEKGDRTALFSNPKWPVKFF